MINVYTVYILEEHTDTLHTYNPVICSHNVCVKDQKSSPLSPIEAILVQEALVIMVSIQAALEEQHVR